MPNTFKLDVPLIAQQHLGYCLPACVQMVLEYYGIHRDQEDLARQLGVVLDVGVTFGNVRRITTKQIDVRFGMGEEEDLLKSLSEGVPPILDVATEDLDYWGGVESQHVVLLAATEDSDGVLYAVVNDPAFDEPITVRMDELLIAWRERDNRFVTIRRK